MMKRTKEETVRTKSNGKTDTVSGMGSPFGFLAIEEDIPEAKHLTIAIKPHP